jgi:outer membrane lipoprotein LolB
VILALRVIVLTLLVTACTTAPPRSALPVAELPETWLAQGRLAVKSGDEAWHGTFAWHQAPTLLRIELAGPLGQGSVRLHEDPDGARLELGTEQVIHGVDSGALLREQLGWAMPVQGLRYWISGHPDPDRPATVERDEAGRVTGLAQDGWQVTCNRYLEVEGGLLPHRVVLEREELRVRLVIDRWQLGPETEEQG